MQGPVPEQPPPRQPPKVDNESGLAVRVTTVPPSYVAAHAVPQLMPAGLEVTVPPPRPIVA